jgi:uncharacterized protein (TIGR03118 family)
MVSTALARSLGIASLGMFTLASTLTAQQHYQQHNLVSDVPGVADVTDPNLVNAWGMSRSSGSPWWVSDNGTGKSTLYTGAGAIAPLVVTIPSGDPNTNPTGTPSGQFFNGTTDFQLTPGNPARFIFVTEDGTISGWNPAVLPATAKIKVNTHSASVFKGVAVATIKRPDGSLANQLYVADFRKGRVQIYNASFHHVSLGDDAFRDESIPKGYAPFNVQNIGGNILVAFALADSTGHDDVKGAGHGYVDVFTTTGHLLLRLQHGNWFNSPWGITQAPSDFGLFSHDLLIGQFGSGQILVFNPVTGALRGPLMDASNHAIVIDGLWDISFGSGSLSTTGGVTSGPATTLFFSAGPNDEGDGLFGNITAIENSLGGDL